MVVMCVVYCVRIILFDVLELWFRSILFCLVWVKSLDLELSICEV